jgi:hypothetical protein
MAGEFQRAVLKLILEVLGGTIEPTPEWLKRPGPRECGDRWLLVSSIYRELTGRHLPDELPLGETRRVDCVLRVENSGSRIIEVDEIQHFNRFRAATLLLYHREVKLAFDSEAWIESSERKVRLEAGGFAAARPPLFPESGGRHLQRAFRDALCDILPPDHGFLPTLRVAKFDVDGWLTTDQAAERMRALLDRKFSNAC